MKGKIELGMFFLNTVVSHCLTNINPNYCMLENIAPLFTEKMGMTRKLILTLATVISPGSRISLVKLLSHRTKSPANVHFTIPY